MKVAGGWMRPSIGGPYHSRRLPPSHDPFGRWAPRAPPKARHLAAQGLVVDPQCSEAANDHTRQDHRAFNGKVGRAPGCLINTVDPAKERVVKRIDGIRNFPAEEGEAPQRPRELHPRARQNEHWR